MPKTWSAAQIPHLAGKQAVVTGANVGLGFQTARELARAGAEVVLACRSPERGEAAVARIREELPHARIQVTLLDLSEPASIHNFAKNFLATARPLDMLVNNAGIMALPQRRPAANGLELQLQTNYLGHFALTGLLLPLLLAAPAARVVSVSSNAHRRGVLHFDDLQLEHSYAPFKSYAQTKLAMLVFAGELQRRATAHGTSLVSVAAHPGLAVTEIGRELNAPGRVAVSLIFRLLGQSDAEGALPQLYAATAPEAQPGAYYGPSGLGEFKGGPRRVPTSKRAQDVGAAARLWELSEGLTGVRYAWPAATGATVG